MKRLKTAVLVLAAASACGESSDMATDDEPGETSGAACEPAADGSEQTALLNAPVAADVEVIRKTPQHPGDPGPEGLP